MAMDESELRAFLSGIYSHLMSIQQGLLQMNLGLNGIRGVMQESIPNFEKIYAKYYEAEKTSALTQGFEHSMKLTAELIARLKSGMN